MANYGNDCGVLQQIPTMGWGIDKQARCSQRANNDENGNLSDMNRSPAVAERLKCDYDFLSTRKSCS